MDTPHKKTPQVQSTNMNAIIALVASLAGFAGFAVIGPILGLVFANMAKKEIAANGQEGAGLVKAAQITAWIQLGLTALALMFILLFVVLAIIGSAVSS